MCLTLAFFLCLESNFLQSLFSFLHKMLLQKEQQSFLNNAQDWIQHEAIEQRHLQDYGTFREALVRCVEDRLTSILSKILEQADANNNLMVLREKPYVDLWVELFEKVFSNLQEIGMHTNMKEGFQRAKFPFSGRVSQIIHDAIKEHVHYGMGNYLMYLAVLLYDH